MIRLRSAVLATVLMTAATAWAGAEITSASLEIRGVSLEIDTVAVTTGVDIPTTIQTKFGGKKNDEAPVVEGLLAVGDLTGPGLGSPIQLTTAPGHRFQIPGFAQKGLYYLQNVRLMNGSEFVLPATPSVATVTVADLLQTSVTVRQLTPDELRARGISLDGRVDVYEYSFTFLIDGQEVRIPFPVVIDPRTHEVTPIRTETPFNLPPVSQIRPPRWTPPDIIPFEFPPDPEPFEEEGATPQQERNLVVRRPSIPAALVIPNSLAVLHQFFGVILTVSNGAPGGSTPRLEDINATIKVPAALRSVKSDPAVAFGQPVPLVDVANGVTFLVAQAKGEAGWTLEGLAPGTHTVEIDVRATYREEGQQPVRLRGTPRATIVVHDARFNLNFSHPDAVRKGLDYSTYTFITNTSAAQQTIRMTNGLPACDQSPGANVCRLGGAASDEITLVAGEMRMIEYKLRSTITGRVFATAGTIGNENLSAAVQLHMGVSETGIPLSPATLILPHYAQYLSPSFLSAQLQLLGLGYSVATAPLTETTAKFPRVIKTDVFYRAVDIARAGQKIFIANLSPATTFDALANLSLDLLGNGVELQEWDQLRREIKSGRVAGAAMVADLNATGMAGRSSVGEFVEGFAAATAHRAPYLAAVAHGPAVAGNARPYALALRSLSGSIADVPNEAESGWKRTLAFADISRFDAGPLGRAGEIALAGRWSGDLELIVTPAVSGALAVEIIFPRAADGGFLRAHLDLTGTAEEAIRIPISMGATTLQAVTPNGGSAAVATASPVSVPQLRVVAARQDLYLDPQGHKVSVLFSRPVGVAGGTDLRTKFHGTIAFNRDSVVFNGPRPIFAAAIQDSRNIVNLSFDHVLTTNATYELATDALLDPITATPAMFSSVLPKIDNDRPAGIVYGKFLKGDNTPIPSAEVRLYTGHYRGCEVGMFDDDPPVDCNPYREAPQYAKSDGSGTYLFEYVPRDPIADAELNGGYRLLGVNTDGRFTIVNGAVRLPGSVHFVNLQLLGRGAAEGTVRYDNGEKVVDAEIFVGSTMFNVGRKTSSNTSGFFRVEDLPVGPITFSAKDAAGNVAFGSGEIATPGQVAQKDLVIYRQPFPGTATVFGIVRRSDDNAPVPGARVGVFSQGYGLSETFTDSAGRYEFRKVPAGFVTVLAAEWTIAIDSVHQDFDLRADETHEVPPLILPIRTPATQTATVSGIVTREDPLHPGDSTFYRRVGGAVVKLGDRPPATTDGEGRFTFEAVPLPWGNVVDVYAYDPETKRVAKVRLPALSESGPNNVSVFLPANSFGDGLIRVRLVNAFGSSVAGFRVIEPGFPPKTLREVGQGVYEYKNAPVGSNMTVFAVSGPALFGDQFATGSARLTFPGQIATLTLRLPGDGTVRVKLRSDLDLIGDVAISYPVWDEAEQATAPKIISASTALNGNADWAVFKDVPALQTYRVESLHPVYGYATASGSLAYDGDLVDHLLQLNRLSTVRGAVYAIDGITPIGGATVRIEDGRRDPGPQQTQVDGTFVFHDVPAAAPFRIIAEITQSGIYRTGIAYGTTPENGGPRDGIAVILRRRGSIAGRVVFKDYKVYDPGNPSNNVPDNTPGTLADNAPVPLAKFWLRELGFPSREFGTNAAPFAADSAGLFVLPNVFVGPLRARAWDPRNQDLEGSWTGELSEEGQNREDVYIGIGNGGTGSITVTVVDPNQQLLPIPNAEVSLMAGGLFELTTTDGTGVARFDEVPVGNYSTSAYSKALGKLGAAASFSVQRDATTAVRVLLEFSGKVTGSLIDPESTPANVPVPGAPVTLTGSNYQSRASTGVIGEFLFEGVREGSFALDAKDTRSNRRARATRTLSAADPQPNVNLQLEPTETLHVAVYLPGDIDTSSGVLAPSVEVTATQRGGDYVRTMIGNPVQLTGLFRNESYHVLVRELGGQQRTFTGSRSFPAGNAANPVTFVYAAHGTVEVLVRQNGAPAPGARVRVSGPGRAVDLFAGPDGLAIAQQMPLRPVAAQATSLDGASSGSAGGVLLRTSVPLRLEIDLGAFGGVTGLVEAEAGGLSAGTRVLATFEGRTLEMSTGGDGRYTFQGIRTQTGLTTSVQLVYVGPDGVTVGAQQTVGLTSASGSQVVVVPTVRLDATPPQLLDVIPADGAIDVAPDTFLRFTFSEPIRADHINNARFQLVAADGSGAVLCTFDPPSMQADGPVVITMRPPPGTPFPLKSNTIYRIIVAGQISDLTGHPLASSRGLTFTTSDYAEPRLIKVVPAANTPVSRSQTFEFHFSEPIDPAPWQPGGTAVFRFFKLAGAGGAVVAERPGRAFLDPANPARLLFGPENPIEPESFYRIVFSGVRDLQGNGLTEQTLECFSFDERRPFVRFVGPVPDGTPLVSGVEYTVGVDLRNATVDGTPATDVAAVEWLRVDGTTETLLTTVTASPFGYRFVAPEAPAAGVTYTLRAIAIDQSGNRSEPSTIAFTVKPNAAPKSVAVTLNPPTAYPGNTVTAVVAFEDEGIVATAQVTVRAMKTGGVEHVESKTKQLNRAGVTAAWPVADLVFTLPPDLATAAPAVFIATVTDVRGLSASATQNLTLTPDTSAPVVVSLTPAAETRFNLNQQYRAETVVSDAETAVAEVVFAIDGQMYRVLAASSTVGPTVGTRKFTSPLITVTARNVDTRIPIVATATDYHGNSATRAVEVIYTGVNDPAIPKAAWICPVDRAALPAAQTAFTIPLRIRATDDIAITSVRFLISGVATPVVATRVGTTDDYAATATVATPAAGAPLVITAEVSDADPMHTIQLPVNIDLVAVDLVVDATQAVTTATLSQYANMSVMVRTPAGRLVTHVPVSFTNLLVLDGGRVESLATTTSTEHRVDVTVTDQLYVDCDSLIDVRAKGYLGGWGPNADGSNTRNESASGRTTGNSISGGADNAGASHGGLGQIADGGAANTVYGSITAPSALGSGGGGSATCCAAGGSGGGAILLRASTAPEALGRFSISGSILASGGTGTRGGSGGSVLITAKQLVFGAASIVSANGADAAAAGGGGRVAVSATERLDVSAPFEQLQARGGRQTGGALTLAGAPGTVLLRRPSQVHGELLIGAYGALDPFTPLTRATPLSGAPLQFDRVELRRYALARFDDSVTIGGVTNDRGAATIDSTALLLLPADLPVASITTAPAAGANLIRATDLTVTLNATSIAGIAQTRLNLSSAPLKIDTIADSPATVSARVLKVTVPFDAALGAATLDLRVVDRADRFVDLPRASFTIVDNQAPVIDAFTALPDALYPGKSVTATVSATDDVRVTKLSVAMQIGAAAPVVQSVTPNSATVTNAFNVTIPMSTPGGTSMLIEAAAEDGFPSRIATKQTRTITILTDANPPAVAITEPAVGQIFNEASGAAFNVRVTATDAEVGIKTITAKAGSGLPVPMTLSAGSWIATVPVPSVAGTEPVPVLITVMAEDYAGNTTTQTVQILVRPLNDPTAPTLRWTCGITGAMFPASSNVKLGVFAQGVTTNGVLNGVQKAEFFIGADPTPRLATTASPNQYEATWSVPDLPDGTTVEIRAVATSVSGSTSDIASTITVVKSNVAPITANLTIDASNAPTYANQTVIVQSGTVTIVGAQTFARLVVLGGSVTHPAGGSNALQLTIINAAYIGCGGVIDASGRGYPGNGRYPGATLPGNGSGGSHIGVGGYWNPPVASTFGSVYRPREAGGGGEHASEGGAGGGVIRVEAGSVVNEGAIRANGGGSGSRGGAGGSVWINAPVVSGNGIVEANGWPAQFSGGGGGAVAIEHGGSVLSWSLNALSNRTNGPQNGGAGSVYVRGASSTYGDLTIDNKGNAGQATDLPSLGRGIAQSGTSGATLVTGRATDIPPYFEGHWIEITRGGTVLGTWRIGSISARTVTLVPTSGQTISLQAGDSWRGIYRFDKLTLGSTQLVTQDYMQVTVPPNIGPGSTILGNNAGPPLLNPALIAMQQLPTGLYVVGQAGAVSDIDLPVTVTARNASGGVFSAAAAANGSFSVQVFGAAGEAITLSARDTNFFPLESASIPVGTLPSSSSSATQISRTLWTTDTTFRSQTIVADGTVLAIASANFNGATSDKLVVLDTTNPAAPTHVRTIATGIGPIRDFRVVNGWAYITGNRLATADLNAATPTVNLAADDPGGGERGIAIIGGYAFTGSDSVQGTIHVYDVSDPAAPRYVRSQTFGPGENVFTDLIPYGSDYLVGLMDNGSTWDVRVIDRRNVNNMVRAGSIQIPAFNARRGSILGSRLYAVAPGSSEMVIVDLAANGNPILAGRLTLPATGAGHVRIAADRAFVANTSAGLTATSIDPASFVVAGSAATTGIAQDVAITSGMAYVANEIGLAIIPVSIGPVIDPNRIVLARSGNTLTATGTTRAVTGEGSLTGTVRNVRTSATAPLQFLAGGSIAATIPTAGGDRIEITVTGAIHPSTTRSLGTAPFVTADVDVRAVIAADNAFFARRIALDGDRTILSGGLLLGGSVPPVSSSAFLFRQPNASEPAQIVTATAAVGGVNDSRARDGFGYFVGSRFTTLNYLNTTPTMNVASTAPTALEYAVAVSGNNAFVAADRGLAGSARGSIRVYDVSSPTAPVFVRSQDMVPEATPDFRELIPFGADKLIAISLDPAREITIINISNPNNLVRLAVFDVPLFTAHRGVLAGNILYLTGGDAGVAIVDLSNPAAPVHLATIDTPGIAFGVAVVNANEIVVADGSRGLTFIDTSTRNQPVILGSQPLQGNAADVKVVGGYIHVATETRYYVLRP